MITKLMLKTQSVVYFYYIFTIVNILFYTNYENKYIQDNIIKYIIHFNLYYNKYYKQNKTIKCGVRQSLY